MEPPPDARLLVVLDRPVAVYSGMVPGFVAGDYDRHELEIDVLPLARRAGAGVLLAAATDLDPVRRELALEGRPPIRFDVASLDVGSTVRGLDLPGVAEHALTTRPIVHFIAELERRLAMLDGLGRPPRLAIVGGGAAGIELAFTLDARLRARGPAPKIELLSADDTIWPGTGRSARRRLRREAEARGVGLHFGRRVVRVEPDGLVSVAAGERDEAGPETRLESDLVVWATGAAPIPFPRHEGLGRLASDPAGFLEVRDTLQAVGFDHVFAAGDCARLIDARWVPRAGVYAVRQGPVLDHNLRAWLAGRRLHRYRPQRDFLSLINLGDGRALGAKWGLAAGGRGVFRLKDWIDRRFMARFQVLDATGRPVEALRELGAMGGGEGEEGSEAALMACGGCAAKLAARPLAEALAALPKAPADESVVLGVEARDDVGATLGADGATTLHNVDVIRAFCDDPWLVGRVAASNALSDLYAKGGRPRHAQALIGLPDLAPEAGREMLFQALSGLRSVLDAAGVSLLGGHTTIGEELSIGLAVTGEGPEASALLRQAGARPGDRLLLTQPLGTGVVLAADMQGLARSDWLAAAHAAMQHTNAVAGELAREARVHAATDVTGFGLAGHLLGLLDESGLAVELDRGAIPCLPGARLLWGEGLRSTAHPPNREAFSPRVEGASETDEAWLFDPQTAGGLLLAVAPESCEAVIDRFARAGEPPVVWIGRFLEARDGRARGRIIVEGASVD